MQPPKQNLCHRIELLLACGWKRHNGNWIAPDYLRNHLSNKAGVDHLIRWVNLVNQVKFEEDTIKYTGFNIKWQESPSTKSFNIHHSPTN